MSYIDLCNNGFKSKSFHDNIENVRIYTTKNQEI